MKGGLDCIVCFHFLTAFWGQRVAHQLKSQWRSVKIRWISLGGGNSNIYVLFSPLFGEMIQFDYTIFSKWVEATNYCSSCSEMLANICSVRTICHTYWLRWKEKRPDRVSTSRGTKFIGQMIGRLTWQITSVYHMISNIDTLYKTNILGCPWKLLTS